MTTLVLAWHGDPDLKQRTVERMREHAAADQFIRGTYIEPNDQKWEGCLHGCLVAEDIAADRGQTVPELIADIDEGASIDWHTETQNRYGIPTAVGDLLDRLYEALYTPPGEVAVRILDAIPPGADLSHLRDRLLLDLLTDPTHGAPDDQHRQAVAGLLLRRLAGDEPTSREWRAAHDSAAAAGQRQTAFVADDAIHSDRVSPVAASNAARGAPDWKEWWDGWWLTQVLHHLAAAPVPTQTGDR